MAEKNLTVTIRRIAKTESRCKRWPGRMWQRIRKALGTVLVRDESFLVCDSSLSESSLIRQGLYNIARCNKYPTADIEITTSRREPSPTKTIETLTLLLQKQPVCQAVLRTTWSHDGVAIQVSAPFDLLVSPIDFRALDNRWSLSNSHKISQNCFPDSGKIELFPLLVSL